MSEVLIYEAEGGQMQVSVRLDAETVWLTQEQMAELFGRERTVVTKHLRNVFKEGELEEKSNVQNLHIAGSDKPVKFYNLNAIISSYMFLLYLQQENMSMSINDNALTALALLIAESAPANKELMIRLVANLLAS